jgi:uncharacterized membrane protein YbaN (DUF454 family)
MFLFRAAWFVTGMVAMALGLLGVFLPLLPTTGFLLLATFCFARSSPVLHDWIVNHPRLGPPIADWRTHGAISRKAKTTAAAMLVVAFLAGVLLGFPPAVLALQAIVLLAVGAFLLTRPAPPEGDPAGGAKPLAKRSVR